MKIVFLPIRPEYSQKILSGKKKWEYRRRLPSQEFKFIIMYSSSPTKRVEAILKIAKCISGSPVSIWRETGENGGISENAFLSYFRGYEKAHAIQIETVYPISKGATVNTLPWRVPQSFRYTNAIEANAFMGEYFISEDKLLSEN